MLRREALKKISLLLGGLSIAPELLAKALANAPATLAQFPADRLALLAEMADTILPDTDTPGAKAARVHEFIAVVMQDCIPQEDAALFWTQLEATNDLCKATHGAGFVECAPAQRVAFFTQLQFDAKQAQAADPASRPFFHTLKNLTIGGYFSSEIGATQALAYDPIPGGWIPDMMIDEKTKAWTPMF
ncbi:MAG: gluconate 2-dehydrogenase subunit 3 family protein [Saprospiraceae bacterium]|nr:gluconate 2-dehydrogenase subunit 3 family protein [Saprospiraceae bacterium]